MLLVPLKRHVPRSMHQPQPLHAMLFQVDICLPAANPAFGNDANLGTLQELRDFQKELDGADFYFGLNLENLCFLFQDADVAKDILKEFGPKAVAPGVELSLIHI